GYNKIQVPLDSFESFFRFIVCVVLKGETK
ncbi:hypothetical protein Q604_UNBC00304G0002, partial [human gut metagenome]